MPHIILAHRYTCPKCKKECSGDSYRFADWVLCSGCWYGDVEPRMRQMIERFMNEELK